MGNMNENKFSFSKRFKSFSHAIRGIRIFIKYTHNAWVHLFVLFLTIIAGLVFDITKTEWMLVAIVAGLVLVSEAFNSAIETHMNLTSPDHHPHAKDTKDIAAGAVLIASIVAAIVGFAIFWPHIVSIW